MVVAVAAGEIAVMAAPAAAAAAAAAAAEEILDIAVVFLAVLSDDCYSILQHCLYSSWCLLQREKIVRPEKSASPGLGFVDGGKIHFGSAAERQD